MQPLIAFDQFLNTIVYIIGDGFGMADETLSARAFRLELQGFSDKVRKLIDVLFFWQDNHCYNAWLSEIERNQLPNFYR